MSPYLLLPLRTLAQARADIEKARAALAKAGE